MAPKVSRIWSDVRRGERIEDFIFGSFANNELKLIYAQAQVRGLQHAGRIRPQDPPPGEPVTLIATAGPGLDLDHLVCYYTTDGREPDGDRGAARTGHTAPFRRCAIEWNTFIWGYVERWACILPPQPEGTLIRYHIGGWSERDGREVWADAPSVYQQIEQVTAAFFAGRSPSEALALASIPPSRPTPFAYSVDRFAPPDWAREVVVYHVFVDRFNPGDGRDFAHPDSLRGFFGGTLNGVTEKLDDIADLGATCIWLSPIFATPTHHGYDATDYYTVDPRWGTNEDLRRLVEEAHTRDIRVLLDLVCNHLSVQHPIFQQALADPNSPYRDWFTFGDGHAHGYRTFFNVATMPRINTTHPAARDYLIQVARHWLTEYDVDGFRLDHANGPELAFWTEFWTACKAVKPDCWCFGEVVEPPPSLLRYAGRLDGLLDFHLCDLLRRAFGHAALNMLELERALARHEGFFPADLSRPSFFDNHDMNRLLYLAGGDQRRLRLAALALMTLPGPPILYYGTEVGLSQTQDRGEGRGLEVARQPMLWGEAQDPDLLAWFRRLIHARRSHPAIWEGERTTLLVDETAWVYGVGGAGDGLLVALNADARARSLTVDAAALDLSDGAELDELLGGDAAVVREGVVTLSLPPLTGGLWRV